MSIYALKAAKTLRTAGAKLGRGGLSERVIAIVADFDGSYKGAMILAGRMRAIASAAKFDGYWGEKVDAGFQLELSSMGRVVEQNAEQK